MDSAKSEGLKTSFPEAMRFRGTWRAYQTRLLEQLESHLRNKQLHIVAAPGSGKTVFGLEAVRRINQPTLVLAPTLTTRNQWVDRLVGLFLAPGDSCSDWVSTDLRRPALFTVATYQALHTLCSEERHSEPELVEEEGIGHGNDDADPITSKAELPTVLAQAGFRTLVADEAHHLRSEWWRTLTFVAEHLQDPTIVALTATPPYDVSAFEWRRYEEFCGPVDAEVSVPELVLQGDLCPHQDYVYFSTPTVEGQRTLAEFRAAVEQFIQRLRQNRAFASLLARHPWITAPSVHVEEILDKPERLSSMIVYLSAVGCEIPKEALRTLGFKAREIPALNSDWLEILLSHCLYTDIDTIPEHELVLKAIRRELLQLGAVERRKVNLRNGSDHTKLLTMSPAKLQSIEAIVRLEITAQGEKLRCVVLTDFIRKREMPKTSAELPTFEDIGVTPIFETLRRAGLRDLRLGVLTGSLVIIPSDCEALLRLSASAMGIRPDDLKTEPLAHDAAYVTLNLAGGLNHHIVRLLTSVFEQGGIRVLIGTKSLLGEGWDAPTINTLVLASFVGSYVLSNQMRGRSIRVDPKTPMKTANIWHLVCVEPGVLGVGIDYDLLARRCSAFAGVSVSSPTIENGIARLGLSGPPFALERIAAMNAATCRRAQGRDALRTLWKTALSAGIFKQMTHGLVTPTKSRTRSFVLRNTIAAMVVQAGATFISVLFRILNGVRRDVDWATLASIAGVAAAVSLPWALLALWRLIRHGTPEKSLAQIGRVVLDSLAYAGSLDRKADEFRVHADQQDDGTVYCWISGGTQRDQNIFLRALREVLRPIDNPRYLLARPRVWRVLSEDYFAVPEAVARKKDAAQYFAKRWRRAVGPVELVYTRTPEGRKVLLRARMHSLAAAFEGRSEHASCWK